MRPSRIVVGEVRQAESLDLLIALQLRASRHGDHVHANSAREAVTKMCTLPLLAGENVSARFVVPTVASSIDIVVHAALERDGRRVVREIAAVPGRVEGDVVEIADLFVRRRGELRRAEGFRPMRSGSNARDTTSPRCWHRVCHDRLAARPDLRRWDLPHLVEPLRVPTPREPRSVTRVGPLERLSDEIVQAGFTGLTVRTLIAACVIAFVLVLAFVQAAVGVLPIAGCFALMASFAPVALVRRRARMRRARLRDLWPDAVDNITSGGCGPGMALPEALSQLGTRGPDELREPFLAFADDYRLSGRFHDCLDRLKERQVLLLLLLVLTVPLPLPRLRVAAR